jgi:antitoxin component of MazEF toxin-antitoxin module
VEEFRDISGELCSLHIILKDVIETLENDSFNLSPTRADGLEELLDQVEDVLAELESEVLEYNTMDTATRQKWQVKGWGLLAVSVIQQRIIYIITTLNAFLSAMKE